MYLFCALRFIRLSLTFTVLTVSSCNYVLVTACPFSSAFCSLLITYTTSPPASEQTPWPLADPGPSHSIQGGYYMRTSGVLQGKGTVIVASPMYTYANRSCVQFSNFLQCNLKEHVNTLSMSTEDENGETQVLLSTRTQISRT